MIEALPPWQSTPKGSGWRGWSARRKAVVTGVTVLVVLSVVGALAGPPDRPANRSAAASPFATVTPDATATLLSTARLTPSLTPAPTLAILEPQDGATVGSQLVIVRGTASAGARVVRDVSLGFDDETVADPSGVWSLSVELAEGVNELTFRIGDEQDTERTIRVAFVPEVAMPVTDPPSTTIPAPTLEPTPDASPETTPVPATPTPAPTPVVRSFADGLHEVGVDIRPGTYRIREPAGFCYWARLSGFSGELRHIIANDNAIDAFTVVTITRTDVGFESSGCGEWSSDLSAVIDTGEPFSDGTYIVGTDIRPGRYRAPGTDLCYWARLRGFGGELDDIIANDLSDGSTIVSIARGDDGFTSNRCGEWIRSGD